MDLATTDPALLVLRLILGAGGLAFLTAVFRFVRDWRKGVEGHEAKAIANLEKWREDADTRALRCLDALDKQRDYTAYWQRRTARAESACERAGVEIPESPPPPNGGAD